MSINNVAFAAPAFFFVISVFVLPTSATNAQMAKREPPLNANEMQAFRTLKKVDYFANGSVGIRGGTSEGETALNVLLNEKNGPVVLRALLKTATPAGKLYALLGLRRMGNVREAAEVASALGAQKGFVNIRRGCMGSRETIRAVATQIQKGRIVSTPHWGERRIGRNKWVAQ